MMTRPLNAFSDGRTHALVILTRLAQRRGDFCKVNPQSANLGNPHHGSASTLEPSFRANSR